MLVVHYSGKDFNSASLTTIILQYRQLVKHVFAILIHNTLQTMSPFVDAVVNQVLHVAVRAIPG